MTAIYKRELKTFFTTVTGWLFIAAHICLAGLYFFAINLLSGYSNVGQSFSSILFLLLLSTPILSMRMLAEAGFIENTLSLRLRSQQIEPAVLHYLRQHNEQYVLDCLQVCP